jgi:hypothetical protein
MSNKSYVYVIFRLDGSPCYVGKGCGKRWKLHAKNARNPHLRNIYQSAGGDLPIIKVREGLSHDKACDTEVALIKAIGRKGNGGPLTNMTDGGDGVRGHIYTEELREKRRIQVSERSPEWLSRFTNAGRVARRGAKASAETLEKLRLSHLGFKRTKESIQKAADKNRGKKRSPEFCASMKMRKGEKRSDQARENMRLGALGKVHSEAHKAAMSASGKRRFESQDERKRQSLISTLGWVTRRKNLADHNGT